MIHRQQAFTLVELAIVLVIVGLLVGGVMVGRDLIEASSMRAQLNQITQYNTAVRTFQEKYGGLPGDLLLSTATQMGLTTSGCSGARGRRDGNGIIQFPNDYDTHQGGEVLLFWSDLSATGLIGDVIPGGGASLASCAMTVTMNLTAGITHISNYLPLGRIRNDQFVYMYYANPIDAGTGLPHARGDGKNWFGISAITGHTPASCTNSNVTMPVFLARHLDEKTDDGLATTGITRAYYLACSNQVPASASAAASDSAATCYNTTNYNYSTSVNDGRGTNCAVSMRLQ